LAEYQLRKGQALDEAGLFFDPEALSEAERHTLPDGSGPILPTCEKQSTAQDSLGSNCKGQRGDIVPRSADASCSKGHIRAFRSCGNPQPGVCVLAFDAKTKKREAAQASVIASSAATS
jgi:hypothetical protein